jgi:hypothetical protein
VSTILREWMRRVVTEVATKRGMSAALKGAVCESEPLLAGRLHMLATITRLVDAAVEQARIRPDADAEDVLQAALLIDQPGASERAVRVGISSSTGCAISQRVPRRCPIDERGRRLAGDVLPVSRY